MHKFALEHLPSHVVNLRHKKHLAEFRKRRCAPLPGAGEGEGEGEGEGGGGGGGGGGSSSSSSGMCVVFLSDGYGELVLLCRR